MGGAFQVRDTRHRRAGQELVVSVAALLASIALACGPAPTGGGAGQGGPEGQSPRTLVYIVRSEPDDMPSSGTPGSAHGGMARFFNATLSMIDQRGIPEPYLAEALPQLNADSWRVDPDGRMETTYRLKPNLMWHDGTPLSAADFTMGWQIRKSPVLEKGSPTSLPTAVMDDVLAPDARSVIIRWSRPYPAAGSLIGAFPPRPRHILEQPFTSASQGDPAILDGHAFWREQYVGLGPYRLDRWEPGAFVEGTAFDRYVLGRPKIDRVRFIFMSDPNTVVANLLAGAAHIVGDGVVIRFQQGSILKREWDANKGGTVLFVPAQVRYAQFQFRPDVARPRAILDVRVRRALAHSADRQGLVDGLFEGTGQPAYHLAPPGADYFAAVDRAARKYPYDPRRVEELMAEAGFMRGADGFFTSAAEGQFIPEWRSSSGGDSEQQLAILTDGSRRAGFAAVSYLLPQAQDSDREVRATFPTISLTSTTGAPDDRYSARTTDAIGSPENRWSGGNRGGWSNTGNDRLVDAIKTTLDRGRRTELIVEAARLTSEEVPILTFYYPLDVIAHTSALTAPWLVAPDGSTSWNIQDWELRN